MNAGTPEIFSSLVVILTLLARAESEYNYQQPSAPFQFQHQQYIPGRPPENVQYAQSLHSFQQSYDSTAQNIQTGQFSNNLIGSQRPSFVASNNYDQSYIHNEHSAASYNVHQTNLNSINVNPVAANSRPVVMKHIYFHVPPPDVEASVASVPIKKKKTYNIVFIKVPSQRPSYHFKNSQGFSVNPYVPVEDKTVIYVLVRKPEDLEQGRTKSAANHEVYYVKYKGGASDAATQITSQLSEVTSAPSLRPGLANGRN